MARQNEGQVFKMRGRGTGYGIRWTEDGRRPQETNGGEGFRTKADAREWFRTNVLPRLARGGPSGAITFDAFADLYLDRWGADRSDRTVATVRDWLTEPRAKFGSWTLSELEGAADDIASWRSGLRVSEDRKHKVTRALRQVLAAAQRWRYIGSNPALEAGTNPQPRAEEVDPFTPEEVEAIAAELGPRDRAIVIVGAEAGLRTNEWTASERRDVSRLHPPTIAVARRYSGGVLTPYPKTDRRAAPLTPRALAALDELPPRIDSPLLFPGEKGGHLNLNNWRNRTWNPALRAAGVRQRGPYHLRHTFATEALRRGVPMFTLKELMGASMEVIELHYGHLSKDAVEIAYDLLAAER